MSLFSALGSTAHTLSAFEQALTVTQNNVSNSSTPGYARQVATFEALPFQQGTGESGGVEPGPTEDTRSTYAEQVVQSNTSSLGNYEQQVQSLTDVQSGFDISGTTGVPNALTTLSKAFSTWSTSPGSATNRQAVLQSAQGVASAFQDAAKQLAQVAAQTDKQVNAAISQVNQLASTLSGYNAQIEAGDTNDPGLSARIYSTLQQLSELTNMTTIQRPNGTMTVLLGNGQTDLVDGTTVQPLSVSYSIPQPPPPANPNGPVSAQIQDANGHDITTQITGGQISGLLAVRNQVLPSIQGNGTQAGSLNQLAQAFADRVNAVLTAGVVSSGPPVVNGAALFTYDATNATNVAASLSVSPTATTATLAAADGTTSNGTALALANLQSSQNPADQMNGQTFTEFYGSVAASVGSSLATAQTGQSQSKDAVTQAESMRSQLSGVDLNQEATQIMQFQQAYGAASKVISVIDTMTQDLLTLVGASQVI